MNIFAYRNYSSSARTLSKLLDAPLIKHEGSKFKGSPEKTVINWGASEVPHEVGKCRVINSPKEVRKAIDKKKFFYSHDPDLLVPFTEDKKVAEEWLSRNSVIARERLSSHSGEGIVVLERGSGEIEGDFPLYTKYVSKRHEYRYHFMKGMVIFRQQKRKKADAENEGFEWKIRSYNNGYVFCINDLDLKDAVEETVSRFLEETELDFGALDVIYNEKRDKGYILEVNTSPALLSDSLAEAYKKNFLECFP